MYFILFFRPKLNEPHFENMRRDQTMGYLPILSWKIQNVLSMNMGSANGLAPLQKWAQNHENKY